MNDKIFRTQLTETMPEVPVQFYAAVNQAMADIKRGEQEARERAGSEPSRKPVLGKKRTLTLVLAAILLITAVAAAATLLRHNVFSVTMGDSPTNAASVTQYNLAKETFGSAEVSIKEAAYDGMSLYVVYGIRDLTETRYLGTADGKEAEGDGLRYISYAEYEHMASLGVGWWTDNLWINGEDIQDMPAMSGGETIGGDEPGEALYYLQFRLDQIGLYLEGDKVEISLPIGERQPRESLVIDPDSYRMELPKKGVITFTLDCTRHKDIAKAEPNVWMEGPDWSARVTEAVYSPIQLYVTLEWNVKPELLEAFIAENGDGIYNDDGVKILDYGGADIFGDEIRDLRLVDGNGKPVFEDMEGFYGCGGYGHKNAWYTFPYLETYPDEMFLAPVDDGQGDMSLAVRVK